MGELRVIDLHRERYRRVRRVLARGVRAVREDRGLAGFALVAWDTRGGATTAFSTAKGPVSSCMMPDFVKAMLSRHQTLNMAVDEDISP